jgi:hypothetical protein
VLARTCLGVVTIERGVGGGDDGVGRGITVTAVGVTASAVDVSIVAVDSFGAWCLAVFLAGMAGRKRTSGSAQARAAQS